MIKDIQELNFPKYATFRKATCALQDMAEKTITSQIEVDGDITPDFSYDWEVEFKGEKYIMPLRKPQAGKENTSLDSTVDLTFQHWAVYQLKRWYFFTIQPVESGTAVPDKYIAPVSLNLKDMCGLFGQVLEYYYGDRIVMDFNDPATHENGWGYDAEPTTVDINHSFLWDVLIKFYELYGVRWQIEPNGDADHYVIKVGYATDEISHIFEYGFEGGLLKVERQVQDEDLRNMLLGRGGDKNLPYRYFKRHDENNKTFSPDPDWIPELAYIYFSELHGATFRSYIQGWKAAHIAKYRDYYKDNQSEYKEKYGHDYPDDEEWVVSVDSADKAYAPWAWEKGNTDEKFSPVEFVADEIVTEPDAGDRYVDLFPGYTPAVKGGSSIDRYGPLQGGLDNNEDIYPSIQGVAIDPYGRVDEAVAIEPIESDDVAESTGNDAQVRTLGPLTAFKTIGGKERETAIVLGAEFAVPAGMHADYDEGVKNIFMTRDEIRVSLTFNNGLTFDKTVIHVPVENESQVQIEDAYVSIIDAVTGEERSASGIPEGRYYPKITFSIYNESDSALNVTIECAEPKLVTATLTEQWSDTWRIWIKNVWNTKKSADESDTEYAERVWRPILGDRTGGEAKVVFADGMLSTSEDYEFVITAIPTYDKKECSWETIENGKVVTHTYESEWCLVLGKNDADLESTGLYVPSTKRQAKAGDHFFFIGTDMPHQYVLWAEERLDDWKKDQLAEVKDTNPTWVVGLDGVRIGNNGRENALIDQLCPGRSLRLADKRFIINELGGAAAYETLYIQSITYTYNEPTSDSPGLVPDVEIVLSDKYETTANPVTTISGEVAALSKRIGSISNVEQIVRAVGDKLYLRKDGMPDRSMSPTEYLSRLSSLGFRAGIAGGSGWGFFKDEDGNWVIETDRLNVRHAMQVNNLVINQIAARSGMIIESAAQMEITRVVEASDGYICYFDQKEGTIANLFKVDDIAYCNRFTADNKALKYYKRRVMSVSEDCLTLTKGYDAVALPDGGLDTGVSGSGIPQAGDVIVHYGSYSDATRRYIKVRDVISGGYERYIEGLDRVDTDGTEYYFVGRQTGVYNGRPRWYVGDSHSYIEYRDGVFNLNNVSLSVSSTIGDKTVEDLLDSAENIDYLKKALPQSTLIENGLILSSLMQLGYTGYNGSFNVMSGLNGIPSGSSKGNGLSYWAGGRMIDKADDAENGATSAIRMDGSAYFANGVISMDETGLQAGENVRLDRTGLHLIVDGEECATITDREIDTSQYLRKNFNTLIGVKWEDLDISLAEYTLSFIAGGIAPVEEKSGTMALDFEPIIPDIPVRPGNPGDIPAQRIAIVKEEVSRTIWSGVNSDSLTLSLNVEIQLNFYGVFNEQKFSGRAIVEILNENSVIASFSSGFTETAALPKIAAASIYIPEYICPSLGNYLVRLRIPEGTSEVYDQEASSMKAHADITCGGTAFFGATPGKVIGRNGIAFCRGNCIIAQDDNTILLRSGRCAIRVSDSGIEKTLDGENWSEI